MAKYLLLIIAAAVLSGCAQNTDKLAMMNAFNQGLVNCKGEIGCITSMNAALYTGAFRGQDDSVTGVIAATLPFAHIGLEIFRLVYGGGGSSGQGFVLNRSNNNTFIGFNRAVADRSSRIDSTFDATSSVSEVRTWENMYNPDNSRETN